MEMESNKFHKASTNIRCPNDDIVFTFYTYLRNIAAIFKIFTLWPASANSNGFQLLYRILELVHPRLRHEKGSINKIILPPTYEDVTGDIIYTFLTRYKKYLVYKSLSPESRTYNNVEQKMFIINALYHDSRLRPGLVYVKAIIQAYRCDASLNISITFPLKVEFDKIGVVLDKYSKEYNVGEKLSTTRSIFTDNGIDSFIHTLGHRTLYKRNDKDGKPSHPDGKYQHDRRDHRSKKNLQLYTKYDSVLDTVLHRETYAI